MSVTITIDETDVLVRSIDEGGLNTSDPLYLYKSSSAEKKCLLKFSTENAFSGISQQDYAGRTVGPYILSSTLKLNVTANSSTVDAVLNAYRCKRMFNASATWSTYDGTNSWETVGALGTNDRDTTDRCYGRILATEESTMISIPIDRRLLQDWVSGAETNNGLILETESEGANITLDADDAFPAMVVEYSPPFLYAPDLVFEKNLRYNTVISVSESGIEQRRRRWQTPVRSWKMRFDLREATDTTYGGLTELYAYFSARAGRHEPFYFIPPDENSPVAVRFESDLITFEHFSFQLYRTGVTLLEVLGG